MIICVVNGNGMKGIISRALSLPREAISNIKVPRPVPISLPNDSAYASFNLRHSSPAHRPVEFHPGKRVKS
jgi:hypothetical protein